MRTIFLAFFLLTSSLAFGQSVKESYFEIRAGYMPTNGNVTIRGEGSPWIATLAPEGNSTTTSNTFASTSFGFGYGKRLSSQARLGLGMDVDFYNNLSEGNTSRVVPLYADFKYVFSKGGHGFYAYAQAGYSFITGTDWHSGAKAGAGLGYTTLSEGSRHGFNFSIGYNYQTLNKLSQYQLSPATQGEGYFGPTNVQYANFVGFKSIIIQTLPIKIAYEF